MKKQGYEGRNRKNKRETKCTRDFCPVFISLFSITDLRKKVIISLCKASYISSSQKNPKHQEAMDKNRVTFRADYSWSFYRNSPHGRQTGNKQKPD